MINNFDDIFSINNNIEVVIIQVGIVEITNRILHDKTKMILQKIPLFGRLITKVIWTHKCYWLKLKRRLKLRDFQKMNSDKFKEIYLILCMKLISIGIKKIYILGIPKLNFEYEMTQNPFINDFINDANNKIKTIENKLLNIKYIDIEELLCQNSNNFTNNTVHFSKMGHANLANYLKKNIEEFCYDT